MSKFKTGDRVKHTNGYMPNTVFYMFGTCLGAMYSDGHSKSRLSDDYVIIDRDPHATSPDHIAKEKDLELVDKS